MPDPQVQLPSVEVTHTGPVFRVERIALAPDASGHRRVKDVVRHPGAVTVVALRDDGMLVLVRNRRIAVDRWLVEFCAGKLEPGEDPAAAAGRELEEETGYSAARIDKVGTFFTSPGFTDEIMHVFVATGLRAVPQRLEPGEEIEVVVMSEPDLRRAMSEGGILDGKTLGAYLLWTMKRGDFPNGGQPASHPVHTR